MRRALSFALVALCGLPVGSWAAGKKTPAKQYTIEQFMSTRRVVGASFSADEKTLLVTADDDKGVLNAFTVPVGGGALVPVTESAETTRAVAFFPRDGRIQIGRASCRERV